MDQTPEIDFAAEGDLCDLCGLAYDGDTARNWLGVELSRGAPDGLPAVEWLAFCSQQHASEWFLRPLPPLEPRPALPKPTVGDRLVDTLVITVLCLIGALFGLGTYTALRFLVDLLA